MQHVEHRDDVQASTEVGLYGVAFAEGDALLEALAPSCVAVITARAAAIATNESANGSAVVLSMPGSIGNACCSKADCAASRYASSVIDQGDTAPDFELPDQDGRTVKLSDFRGQPVVVYFYPKAATSGCTTQACGVRDHRADYERAHAVVLGISPDPVAKVKKFHDNEGLNFALLADEDHSVADTYGVWVTKSMYGRTYLGNERTTFIIDPAGKVADVLRKVKPSEHDELVLRALDRATPAVA
jgi:peroxiredoxin Q/BCP